MCLEEVEEETWIVFSSYEKLLVSSNIACRGARGKRARTCKNGFVCLFVTFSQCAGVCRGKLNLGQYHA